MIEDKILHAIVGLIIYGVLRKCGLYKVSCALFVVVAALGKELFDAVVDINNFNRMEFVLDALATILPPYLLMITETKEPISKCESCPEACGNDWCPTKERK